MITIIGLGQSLGHLTLGAACELRGQLPIVLRTGQHPITGFLQEQNTPFETLDALYEQSEDFDELLFQIASYVVSRDPCVYGVPGGGGFFDESVCAVVAMANMHGIETRIIPGVGLAEETACEAGGAVGGVLLPALSLERSMLNPRLPLVVTELGSLTTASEVKLLLLDAYPEDHRVILCGKAIPLEELDRQASYDHLSRLFVPPISLEQAQRYDIEHLRQVIKRLRAPDGCPWDREQTHRSLKRDLLEECYEALQAIDEDDMDKLYDELGDVLLHVAMHAEIADEHGEFNLYDVTSAICAKMISRHPHVFGDVQVSSSEEVIQNWNEIKKVEKQLKTNADAMRDVPASFPALMRAEKVQKRAKAFGFDFASFEEAFSKVEEESKEVLAATGDAQQKELGDLLFSVVNACRFAGVAPELALQATTERFILRVEQMEQLAQSKGLDLTCMNLAQMDILWEQAKEKLSQE